VLAGSIYVGQWIYRPPALAAFHPGYFLPTVAGGFVASASAALVGQAGLAEALFGMGLISWMVVGSIVFGRLLFAPPLPPALTPTLAILVAPAGVATFAYFTIDGDRVDRFAAMIAGYGLLMVLAQLRLVPLYRRLPFASSFWAFTFAWAAVVFGAMFWLAALKPPGWQISIDILLAVITVAITAVAAATAQKFRRGDLLPPATAHSTFQKQELNIVRGERA